jgi:hypothetical protein
MSPHSPFTTFGPHSPSANSHTPSSDGGECCFFLCFLSVPPSHSSSYGSTRTVCARTRDAMVTLLPATRGVGETLWAELLTPCCQEATVCYIEERATFSRLSIIINWRGANACPNTCMLICCMFALWATLLALCSRDAIVISDRGTENVLSTLFRCGVNARGYAILHDLTS